MLTTQPENKNTKKKMMNELNIVLKFLREVQKLKKGKNVDNIPPEEMNLSEFIIAARTKKGEQYEPSSLRGILSSVYCYMYLARREYGKRLFIDPEFMRLRDTSKTKHLKRTNKKKRCSLVKYFFKHSKRNFVYVIYSIYIYLIPRSWPVFFWGGVNFCNFFPLYINSCNLRACPAK